MMEQHVRQSAIRWPGLAAFFIIVGLLVAFSWLLLDSIIKWTIESTAGTLNGAEVNIGQVEHGWMPLSLALYDIEVTDPAKPESNRLVIAEARGDLDLGQFLIGRTIIEQLNLAGIRVNQPRESAGEVYQDISQEDLERAAQQSWEAIQMEMPSLDEVMATMELSTDKVTAAAEANFKEQKAAVEAAREALPSEETLADYEQQVKAITDDEVEGLAGLEKKRQQLAELKERFQRDRDAVQDFKTVVTTAKETLQRDLEAVREAPAADLKKIREFTSMDGAGLENVTALIFGEQIRSWSKYVLLAYEQLAPMLARSANEEEQKPARGEGIWFSFTEESAPPEFLIKEAITEFAFGETVLDVNWQNITHQHQQLGQPTTFQARADNTALWQSFNLNGELSVSDAGVDARQQWQLRGAKLADVVLSDRPEFLATLAATLLDSEGSVAVRDNLLDGDASVRLAELNINASGEDRWAELLSEALGQLNRLDIRTELAGSLTSPELSLNSDLDRQLGAALQNTAMNAASSKLSDIEGDLNAKAESFLAEQSPELQGLIDLESLAGEKENQLDGLMDAKVEDQVKDKLKEGLLKRLGGND